MECINCGYELIHVYAARSIELQYDPDSMKWIEKNIFSAEVTCPNCLEELSDRQIEELHISVYWP